MDKDHHTNMIDLLIIRETSVFPWSYLDINDTSLVLILAHGTQFYPVGMRENSLLHLTFAQQKK